MLGTARQADAEDVTQEVFVKLFHHLQKFRGQSKFSTWLYRVSINLAIDCLRKQSKHEADELDQFNQPVSHRNAEHNHLDREKSDSVLAAIAKLEHSQRMIIHLYYWQGFKIREVAEILDCPEGTIKVYLLRAREKLSSLLERMKS